MLEHREHQMWNLVTENTKKNFFNIFTSKIRKWKDEKRPSRIDKINLNILGQF